MSPSLLVRRAALPAALAALLLPSTARAQTVDPDPVPLEPAVTLTAPTTGANLGAGVQVTMTAEAQNAAYVTFHLDGNPVPICLLFTLRQCPWTPTVADIGVHTIEARATDATGRTVSSSAQVRVGRLIPPRVTAATTRTRLGRSGWRFATKGSVAVPAGLTTSACGGIATITVLSGVRTIVDRTARVGLDCSFASTVKVAAPATMRAVRVKVTFDGAAMLAPRAAPTQILHLR